MNESETNLLTTSRFRVVGISQRSADGAVRRREVIRHPGAVTVIPLVDEDHVCLIRNMRPAVGQSLIELPAGTLEAHEPPATTAARELVEETGYRAGQLEFLHAFYLSPGILDEKMHVYVARDLTAGTPEREPGEQIDNLVVPWAQALEMVEQGVIQDAKTIVGLLLYDRLRKNC